MTMTDSELVEAVAREVMGRSTKFLMDAILLGCEGGYRKWDPFNGMNDIQLVKEKLQEEGYWMDIRISPSGKTKIKLHKNGEVKGISHANNEVRAWLEAALAVKRGRNERR